MRKNPVRCRRRGYSTIVVLIFLVLLFALWSTVFRTTSSLIRIETNRISQQTRDQGAINALAQAIQLLQYGKPSNRKNPRRTHFVYGVVVTVVNASRECEPREFTVEFDPEPGQDPKRWRVHVYPGSYHVPLPKPGANPQWP
jgi:hypothetical protein